MGSEEVRVTQTPTVTLLVGDMLLYNVSLEKQVVFNVIFGNISYGTY